MEMILAYSFLFRSCRYLGILVLTQLFLLHVSYAQSQDKQAQVGGGYNTIEWTDLMPEEDLDALLNPPESLGDIADGSVEDQIASQVQMAIAQAGDSRYQQALVSTRIGV